MRAAGESAGLTAAALVHVDPGRRVDRRIVARGLVRPRAARPRGRRGPRGRLGPDGGEPVARRGAAAPAGTLAAPRPSSRSRSAPAVPSWARSAPSRRADADAVAQGQRTLLETFASLAGSRLELEAERRAANDARARMAGLVEAGIALAGELAPDELLARILRAARQLLGARHAALAVLDEAGALAISSRRASATRRMQAETGAGRRRLRRAARGRPATAGRHRARRGGGRAGPGGPPVEQLPRRAR